MIKKFILVFILFFSCCGFVYDGGKGYFFKKFYTDKGVFGEYREKEILVLSIPKINFLRKVYSLDSEFNNVDLNVELLGESDIFRNIFFLAGHSGSGDNCYFNDLVMLEIGDMVIISLDDRDLLYRISDIYYVDKVGYMDVRVDDNSLFLITCSLVYLDKQLVVVGSLIL